MLESLSSFFDWLNQLETEFLHENYTHIKMHIMAYKFEDEEDYLVLEELLLVAKRKAINIYGILEELNKELDEKDIKDEDIPF